MVLALTGVVTACGDRANGKTPDAKDKEAPAIPVEVRAPKRGGMVAIYSGQPHSRQIRRASVVAKVGARFARS